MNVERNPHPKVKLQLVQMLRGLAAVLVVVYHSSLNSIHYFSIRPLGAGLYDFGWVGVEFFFVLSGFIITYVHIGDIESRRNVYKFMRRRLIRIYPIYWVVAVVMLFYYLFIKKENAGITVTVHSLDDLVYLLKCFILFPTGASRHNFIDVAWTLNYEMWFYIVFAICIKLGFQRASRVFFGWAFLILFKYYTKIGDFSPVLNFMLNPIILYFLMGCIVAYLIKKRGIKLTTVQLLLSLSAVLALFFLYAGWSGSLPEETRRDINYSYLLMIIFSLLLWWAATMDQERKTKVRASPALLLVGDASYSIYLTHPSIIMLLYKSASFLITKYKIGLSVLTGNLIFLLVACGCILIGIIIHVFVERRMLAFFNREAHTKKAALLLQ